MKCTILVVDDDENFRHLARQILEPKGFGVLEAENVKVCFDLLRSYPVDVVVLDMAMPDCNGFEALKDLKNISPATKVVTVSGARESELYLATSEHLGADASLTKSKIASLCALLQLVLES